MGLAYDERFCWFFCVCVGCVKAVDGPWFLNASGPVNVQVASCARPRPGLTGRRTGQSSRPCHPLCCTRVGRDTSTAAGVESDEPRRAGLARGRNGVAAARVVCPSVQPSRGTAGVPRVPLVAASPDSPFACRRRRRRLRRGRERVAAAAGRPRRGRSRGVVATAGGCRGRGRRCAWRAWPCCPLVDVHTHCVSVSVCCPRWCPLPFFQQRADCIGTSPSARGSALTSDSFDDPFGGRSAAQWRRRCVPASGGGHPPPQAAAVPTPPSGGRPRRRPSGGPTHRVAAGTAAAQAARPPPPPPSAVAPRTSRRWSRPSPTPTARPQPGGAAAPPARIAAATRGRCRGRPPPDQQSIPRPPPPPPHPPPATTAGCSATATTIAAGSVATAGRAVTGTRGHGYGPAPRPAPRPPPTQAHAQMGAGRCGGCSRHRCNGGAAAATSRWRCRACEGRAARRRTWSPRRSRRRRGCRNRRRRGRRNRRRRGRQALIVRSGGLVRGTPTAGDSANDRVGGSPGGKNSLPRSTAVTAAAATGGGRGGGGGGERGLVPAHQRPRRRRPQRPRYPSRPPSTALPTP